MELHYLLKGIILGFSIAAPVGPIGVLCIRRTLTDGKLAGFVSGLGAATADAAYGFIAAFGLTAVSALLLEHRLWIRLIGGLFLLYLGVKIFLSKTSAKDSVTEKQATLVSSYTTTLLLTITNPMTILSFVAIFAGLGIGAENKSYFEASMLVGGVFLGSALWWLLLSGITGLVRHKLTPRTMTWINRFAGFVILAFSFIALLGLKA